MGLSCFFVPKTSDAMYVDYKNRGIERLEDMQLPCAAEDISDLDISENFLNDVNGISELFPNLTRLGLRSNPLRNLDELQGLQHLTYLALDSKMLSAPEDILKLSTAIPQCDIRIRGIIDAVAASHLILLRDAQNRQGMVRF